MAERDLDELAHGVRLPMPMTKSAGSELLQHAPHRLDVVAGETPVAPCVEVPETQLGRMPWRMRATPSGQSSG